MQESTQRRGRCLAVFLAVFISLFVLPALADDPDIRLTQVSGMNNVVDIANAGDGSNRLFLVRQPGTIYILDSQGELLQPPFLDIRNRVEDAANEQGLLSLAFAPDYAESGYFYVWYTGSGGGTVLARFQVSEDPNVADPDSFQLVLNVAQPFDNHNGGRLQFGPDGMLYLGLGDGGGSFDPNDAAQDGTTLLGKLIRIDVDPAHGTYAVPPDNPFVGNPDVLDEIWATGLRNPWRISFDRGTGDLFIADVGQNQLEEINFQAARSAGGDNYGWDIMEGSQCTGGGGGCNQSGLTLPVAEYDHDLGCSVTGGEVYRGQAYPEIVGMYFFGDYCTGRLWGLKQEGEQWVMTEFLNTNYRFLTFGVGEDGSVYAAGQAGGIFLLSDGEVKSEEGFTINAGLNDAWYNPATAGQGFLIAVFPGIKQMFVAWFTYDAVRPPVEVTAQLGEPGHRWLTAQGPYEGNTANLTIFVTKGGVFDAPEPNSTTDPDGDGTMTIEFADCTEGLVTYEIESLSILGEIPVQRIVIDNVSLCEALAGP